MRTERTGPAAFTVEFESEAELEAEERTNLSAGGLRLPTREKLAIFSKLTLLLRLAGGGEARATATVVAPLPDGFALHVEGDAAALALALRAAPDSPGEEALEEAIEEEAEDPAARESVWDRLRGLSRVEKLLLATKADRMERTVLAQDSDPQVLYSLLKNPRLTADEVIRIAKSPFLTFQTAEAMMKSTQWFSNLEVRVALVHNAKTPPAFALRILPTLPESEVRNISRGAATSMALKVAALKKLQGFS